MMGTIQGLVFTHSIMHSHTTPRNKSPKVHEAHGNYSLSFLKVSNKCDKNILSLSSHESVHIWCPYCVHLTTSSSIDFCFALKIALDCMLHHII